MPEQTTTRCGLLTSEGTSVALTGVSVTADVRSLCARVTVTQRYVNTETQPIEAVYVFPLDEGAAVCGFEARVDGVRIVGEVKERDEAFQAYDEAMADGHGAYLLDEERPDVFQASVGNLPPGAAVELAIVYVVELGVEQGALRFVIPTTVAPRYAPSEDCKGVGRPDALTLNPPRSSEVPYRLDLAVRLATPRRPSRIASPTHPIDVVFEGDTAVVTLAQRDAALDRDFVLAVDDAGVDTPTAWIETSPQGDTAVAVSFVPRFGDEVRPAEVIFVIDRSGSMAGTSIAEVRNALQLCLRSMIPGCRFNIVGFGSHARQLFDRSRAYDEASLAEASAHVSAMQADLGGTEILSALRMVFEDRVERGTMRQVVVVTDGEVTNTDAALELVKKHAASHRVFAFGIGAGASAHLVRGIARAGGGTAEFIVPGERIEPKVLRLFGRLLGPALTDVRMNWGRLGVTQAPSDTAPLFAAERLVIYGFVANVHATTVRLEASGPSGPLHFEVPIDPASAVEGSVISTLAARARIRELEESPEWLEARGSRQDRRRASTASAEILRLALRYSLLSRETSFVAVERRDAPVTGDVQLRRIPVALTHGWGGRREGLALFDRVLSMPAAADAPFAAPDGLFQKLAAPLRTALPAAGRRSPDVGRVERLGPWARGTRRDARDEDLRARMLALIRLQRADGTWTLSGGEFERVLAMPHGSLARRAADDLRQLGVVESPAMLDAWATTFAIGWLEAEASIFDGEWRMVARKGRDAIDRSVPADLRDRWRATVRSALTRH